MRTLVLGSGPSALAYLYYNQDAFALAGEQPGGMFAQQKNLGPQLLWADEHTHRLLMDLGLPVTRRKVKIGYYKDGVVIPGDQVKDEDYREIRKQYAYKTRGIADRPELMSQGHREFECFTIGVDTLVEYMLNAVQFRLVPTKAKTVGVYDRLVIDIEDQVHSYDKLVSTIPAPGFLNIAGCPHLIEKLEAFDKIYVKMKYTQLPEWLNPGWVTDLDYVYVADHTIPFHRAKMLGDGVVLEYSVRQGTAIPQGGEDLIVHKLGQIIRGGELFGSLPSYVQVLGRYAEWKPGVKLNQVLENIHAEK